jgi:hypothetical protein
MITKDNHAYKIECAWEHDCHTHMKLDNANYNGAYGIRLVQGDKSLDMVLPPEIASAIKEACDKLLSAQQSVQATGRLVRRKKVSSKKVSRVGSPRA